MKLTNKQIEVIGIVAIGKTPLARDWRTHHALIDRGLIEHPVTWKYPDPFYQLTDAGRDIWKGISETDSIK